MIESYGLPIALSVALFALLSVAPFVLVVFLMTGVAVHRRVFEGRCEMASLASDFFMLAHQGEPRLIMVER
jgi:hypothetical protein